MRKQWTKEELVAFEDNIERLYLDNQIPCLFHMSGGNEEQLLEIFKEIKEGDYVIGSHRSHYLALLHGIPPEELTQKIINGQSMFLYDRSRNFLVSAIIGGTPAIAAGIAWALKRKGSKQKVWCFVGDGTEDNGHFFEASRYVEGFDLPCTFIVESNGMSIDTSNEERWGKTSNINWDRFSCVRKYHYKMVRPHIRTNGMIDLKKMVRKTDLEYFPPIKHQKLISTKQYSSDISYKDGISQAMKELGENEKTIFIGYNVVHGNAGGSTNDVLDNQKLETPVAENLMLGLGLGMSLEGFKPVVYFERHDFMTVAMDAIINHLDKIERLSHGQFKTPVIIKAVSADAGPFYSGPTHSQDFTEGLKKLISIPVLEPKTGKEVLEAYNSVSNITQPVLVIEKKSLY